MKSDEVLNKEVLNLISEKEGEFYHEADKEWERKSGICPDWRSYLNMRVMEMWADLNRRN